MSIDEKALEIARRVHIVNIGRGDDLKMAIEAYEAAKEKPDNSIGARIAWSKEHSTRQPVECAESFENWYPHYHHGAKPEFNTEYSSAVRIGWNGAWKARPMREYVGMQGAILDGCPLYSDKERDGMYAAFIKAQENGRGVFEQLFAVATFIQRERGYLPPLTKPIDIEGQS